MKYPLKIVMSFFHWFCKEEYREELEGDLLERFQHNSTEFGGWRANQLFIRDVILLFRPGLTVNFYQLTHTGIMQLSKHNKRLKSILIGASSLLLIPLIAMLFTNEVQWKIFDFIVAGVLLLGTGFGLEMILRKFKTRRSRILFIAILFSLLLLIWAELAVGIFGTPFAGS